MTEYNEIDKQIMYNTFISRSKSRLQELITFAKASNFHKIGVANCKAVQPYADKLIEHLKDAGFEVFSIN